MTFDVTGIPLWSYERKAHGKGKEKGGGNAMKDQRKFKDVIQTIKGAEKDKDKFCKAARIERQPMSDERLKMILESGLIALGMILIFLFFFTLFYLCR